MLLTDGSGTVSWGAQPVAGLPSQTSNSGRLLTTNGSTASWSNAVTVSGSNATVSGTLTVSGTGTSTFAGGVTIRRDQAAVTGLIVDNRNGGGSADLFLSEDGGSSNYFRIYRSGSTTGTPNVVNISNIVGGSASTTAIEFGSPVKALSTTASTSTSTGALVVGNGTSGGLGVGGAANIGGALTISGNFTINSNVGIIGKSGTGTGGNWRFVSDDGNSRWLTGLLGGSGETSYSIYDSVNSRSLLTATAAGVVQINQTTASTSTSSGALVVSGGVGVAGAIYAGARIQSAVDLVVDAGSGSANAVLYLAGRNSGTQNLVTLTSNFEGALTITPKAGQGTTIASSLTTAAPTGGTAAAWKLGTVASVSPTSPNRTIEVDIGGTIYYIHAKTTNN
jgi:hypothetical protein